MGGPRPSDFDLAAKELISSQISRRKPSQSDIDTALKAHALRSPKARAVDEGMTNNVTNVLELWLSDPARFDFMGVDTAKPKKKKRSGNR